MRSYGQFCPVAKAAQVFCERWTALLLRDLSAGPCRFNDLRRGVPMMSPSVLSHRLKELELEGIIAREQVENVGVFYRLTPAGEEFVPLVQGLGVWGQRWTRRQLEEGEMDLSLLLFDMEHRVRPGMLPAGRRVIRFELHDQPPSKRRWWFVNEESTAQICFKDPGFDVDLYFSTDLATLIYVWRGDVSLGRALESGRLEVLGEAAMRKALPAWLGLGVFANVKSRRPDGRIAL
jgi:DNA-binding HxlR family transcriptional regulator